MKYGAHALATMMFTSIFSSTTVLIRIHALSGMKKGQAVAMLHILNAKYNTNGRSFPVQYIYAAATQVPFRGRGIMAALIGAAVKDGAAKGCLFTFLLPSNDGLYNYYARLGFKASFYIKKAILSRNELINASSVKIGDASVKIDDADNLDLIPAGGDSFFKMRQAFFSPAVLWGKPELSYALAELQFTGGEILCFGKGYALCRKSGCSVEVKEICGKFADAAGVLLSHFDSDKFTFYMPPYINAPFETQMKRYGMLIPSDNSCDIFEAATKANPYVNLLLE